MSSRAGQLLVATPQLGDSTFERSVVLIVDDDDTGTLGVVLNRPTAAPLEQLAPALWSIAAPPAVVFTGGPVSPDVTVCLSAPTAGGLMVWTLSDPSEATDPGDGSGAVRVFRGYAGWSPGQLDDELEQEAWWLLSPAPGDILGPSPADLWPSVLRRQPAPLSFLATLPRDIRMN